MMKENQQLIQETVNGKCGFTLLKGNCADVLEFFPKESVHCVITSPPYWKQREYEAEEKFNGSMIGNEDDPKEYVTKLVNIFSKLKPVLKHSGSLWLNIGDKYYNKNLMGMPWRVALAMKDDGWILRNAVIWNRIKGSQSSKDRLRTVYEQIFHFVKSNKYYYDYESILVKPKKIPSFNGTEIISATGVSGKRYRQQIHNSKKLTEQERKAALNALEETLQKMRDGKIVDFRMTIRGEQRTLHSDSKKVSGRAKELAEKGFYILKSNSKGFMPNDIWNIPPEDELRTDSHYAVFPIELLEIPIKATCPRQGLVLDPFMGTGSTILAANTLGRRGIGIDISDTYVETAKKRLKLIQQNLE